MIIDDPDALEKISDILFAAGYFRAKIKAIDAFDMILGGMCWCITGASFDVDVEFKDDLDLGKKIKLSEKVVTSLIAMKCPYSLQPHQIKGLDYKALFNVIQWLVKILIESRDDRSRKNRKQALFHVDYYTQNYISHTIKKASDNYIDKRYYRRKVPYDPKIPSTKKIYGILREYNDKSARDFYSKIADIFYGGSGQGKAAKGEKMGGNISKNNLNSKDASLYSLDREDSLNTASMQDKSDKSGIDEFNKIEAEVEKLEGFGIVKSDQLANIFQDNMENLEDAIYKFKEKEKKAEESSIINIYNTKKETYESEINRLNQQIQEQNELLAKSSKKLKIVEEAREKQNFQFDEASELQKNLNLVIQKITKNLEENEARDKNIEELKSKVQDLDKLRGEKPELLKKVKAAHSELKAQIKEVENKLNSVSSGEGRATLQVIDTNYDEEYKELLAKKEKVAARNKEIMIMRRKMDQNPSTSELKQYIDRFVELYDQVNRRNEEYKMYLDLHNTFNDTKELLDNELIHMLDASSEYKKLKSSNDKKKFKELVMNIVKELKSDSEKAELNIKKLKEEVEKSQKRLDETILMERNYLKIITEFQKQILINQELNEKLAQIEEEKTNKEITV